MTWLRRLYCRWFHNSLMLPRHGRAICSRCQQSWDASPMEIHKGERPC